MLAQHSRNKVIQCMNQRMSINSASADQARMWPPSSALVNWRVPVVNIRATMGTESEELTAMKVEEWIS